jgi:SAM-dependent methyltransferase
MTDINSDIDRAGQDYWTDSWKQAPMPPMHDLDRPSIRNWIDIQYMRVMRKVFRPGQKMAVIELGCGNSVWLPYFKKYFDADVSGLDYTPDGCRTARQVLAAYGFSGDIVEGDIFNPPEGLKDKFDVVYTNGVVEHFADTADCLKHCAAFANTDGVVVTFIPNIKGVIGSLQKLFDGKVYDVHVPLDLPDLQSAHEKAGLNIIESGYLMPCNFYVVNTSKFKGKIWYLPIRAVLSLPTKLIWILEFAGLQLPRNRFLSSYIYVIARRD